VTKKQGTLGHRHESISGVWKKNEESFVIR
jgi:hypothetical protein